MFWGMRGNYRSIPTDCPQRDERQGWLGDRWQVSRSESYMFDVAAFYSKWMTTWKIRSAPSGSIPDVVAELLAALQRRPHLARHVPLRSTACSTTSTATSACWRAATPAMKKWIDYEKTFVEGRPDLQGPVRRLVRAAGRSRS